jgi:hypothetical protein
MTRPDPHDPNGSTRIGGDTSASGTTSGADVTGRMAGTSTTSHTTPTTAGIRHEESTVTDTSRPAVRTRDRVVDYKTSAAATFALVFGLASLFCALTGILAPAAVLFGIIGLILAALGLKMTKRLGVTGRGVAIGGLVTALLGFLLGAAVLAGAAVYVNEQGLDRLEQQFDNARDSIPSGSEVRDEVESTVNN